MYLILIKALVAGKDPSSLFKLFIHWAALFTTPRLELVSAQMAANLVKKKLGYSRGRLTFQRIDARLPQLGFGLKCLVFKFH